MSPSLSASKTENTSAKLEASNSWKFVELKKGSLLLIQFETYLIKIEPFYQKRDKLNHVDCPISVQIYRVSEHVFHQQSLFVANDNKEKIIALYMNCCALSRDSPSCLKTLSTSLTVIVPSEMFFKKCHWQRCCFRRAKQLSNFEGVSFFNLNFLSG